MVRLILVFCLLFVGCGATLADPMQVPPVSPEDIQASHAPAASQDEAEEEDDGMGDAFGIDDDEDEADEADDAEQPETAPTQPAPASEAEAAAE